MFGRSFFMKFFYQDHAKKSGIYKIINIHTNRIYIGQAKPFKQRWYGHKCSLLNGKHQNKFLQNDYNKCKQELGNDDFLEFHVLEVMENSTKKERNFKEEFYIASVFDKQEQCYNFHEKTEAKERSCYSNTPEETFLKKSISMKKTWENAEFKEKTSASIKKSMNKPETHELKSQVMKEKWQDPEHREKVVAHRQRPELKEQFMKNCHTKETIEKVSQARKKNHGKIISPIGEVFDVVGLKDFCLKHDIPLSNLSNLQKVLNGKMPSINGWRQYREELIGIKYENQLTERHFNYKNFKLISPSGMVVEGINVTQFCKIHGLQQQNITKVLSGKRPSHLGWRLSNN